MNDKINLSLGSGNQNGGGAGDKDHPVAGYFAVGFGLLGIFTYGYVFVPLAIITSFIALFMGQFIWFALGLMLAVIGFVTSPTLWLMVGLGALATWMRKMGVPIPANDGEMGSALLQLIAFV